MGAERETEKESGEEKIVANFMRFLRLINFLVYHSKIPIIDSK